MEFESDYSGRSEPLYNSPITLFHGALDISLNRDAISRKCGQSAHSASLGLGKKSLSHPANVTSLSWHKVIGSLELE